MNLLEGGEGRVEERGWGGDGTEGGGGRVGRGLGGEREGGGGGGKGEGGMNVIHYSNRYVQ